MVPWQACPFAAFLVLIDYDPSCAVTALFSSLVVFREKAAVLLIVVHFEKYMI